MLEYVLHTTGLNVGLAAMLTADIPDERMAEQPVPGTNHPAWILGHLAVTADYGMSQLGSAERTCPQAWEELFGIKSTPVADVARYPDKAQLLEKLNLAVERFKQAVAGQTPEAMASPLPDEHFREVCPKVGDLACMALTMHFAYHLGQLSAWRRMAGLPRVM
ncbi:MAG: DinB family protein [Phycisphaeraceae bacterium]|nr:DinB family protein [Phycisphaeraceae bacterium]